jgi:Protein of unknown function (DUF3995)
MALARPRLRAAVLNGSSCTARVDMRWGAPGNLPRFSGKDKGHPPMSVPMATANDGRMSIVRQETAGSPTRTCAYLAAAWALIFAAMSFYWAAGGTIGASTVGATANPTDPAFVALVWGTGVLKAMAALIVLALMRGANPRWLWLTGTATAGTIITLYGAANLGARALMALGVIATPPAMHTALAGWHLYLWDPWWLAGGLLFLGAWFRETRESIA